MELSRSYNILVCIQLYTVTVRSFLTNKMSEEFKVDSFLSAVFGTLTFNSMLPPLPVK